MKLRVRVLLLVLVLVTALGAASAWSADERPEHVFVYTGTEFTSFEGSFSWIGSTIAPIGPLDKSGFRIGVFGGEGYYSYDTDEGLKRHGRFETVDLMVGYNVVTDNSSTKVMIGANAQEQVLSTPDPTNPVQGTRFGFKVQADTYINPTHSTLLFALASYSEVFRTYYTTVKFGTDISGGQQIFLGPQVTALGNARFDQWRLGVHLTAVRFGKVSLDLSGGYLHDSDQGGGAYGAISGYFQF